MQQPAGPIAFSRLTGDYWQIWTMTPDGESAKQITTSPSDKRYPCWTGREGKILFRTSSNKVFQLDLNTNEESPVLEEFGLVGHVVESPDGSTLLFVRFNSETEDISNLWTCTIEGKEQRVLTRDAGLQYNPAWSHDGKQIIYISGHGYQTHELYTIDSDGKNKQKITNNKALELLPAFSPDNKTIAYSSDNTGDFEIWLIDSDGSNPRQLTDSDGIDTRPCWSPDGNRIMFVSNRNENQQIWIMNKDGSEPRQLTTGAPSIDPTWKKE